MNDPLYGYVGQLNKNGVQIAIYARKQAPNQTGSLKSHATENKTQ